MPQTVKLENGGIVKVGSIDEKCYVISKTDLETLVLRANKLRNTLGIILNLRGFAAYYPNVSEKLRKIYRATK